MLSSKIDMVSTAKNEHLWKISSKLHRKTLVFFTLLILLASVLSIVAIYHHKRGEAVLETITAMNTKYGDNNSATLGNVAEARIHVELENGLTIMTVILVSVLVLFMFFFIRNIIQPLSKLEKITRDMADGRLDHLVQDSKNNTCSIGKIGENVNSLAMNLQEVLLLVWNLSKHNLETLEKTIENLEKNDGIDREEVQNRLRVIKTELEQMQDLTRQFEFFDVTLQDKKALAKDDTANSQPY